MAKLDFRGLIPGKRYKIVIHPETVYGQLRALPTIDFVVPEATPRARNHRLSVKTAYKRKTTAAKRRKFRIWKYKISQPTPGGTKFVVIITGNGTFVKNKVKSADKIRVTGLGTNYNTSSTDSNFVPVKNTSNTPKNRIRYVAPNQSAAVTDWQLYSSDDAGGATRVVTVKGTQEVKIPVVKLRIPKPIYENLMWNDTVKDFVHVIYRTGKSRATLSGPRKYFVDDTNVNKDTPKASSGGWSIDNYVDGHPPVFSKEITDDNFYQFEFVVVRYTRPNTSAAWTANWMEQNTPFAKRISRPIGWKA